jgi:hypothetical protein
MKQMEDRSDWEVYDLFGVMTVQICIDVVQVQTDTSQPTSGRTTYIRWERPKEAADRLREQARKRRERQEKRESIRVVPYGDLLRQIEPGADIDEEVSQWLEEEGAVYYAAPDRDGAAHPSEKFSVRAAQELALERGADTVLAHNLS